MMYGKVKISFDVYLHVNNSPTEIENLVDALMARAISGSDGDIDLLNLSHIDSTEIEYPMKEERL